MFYKRITLISTISILFLCLTHTTQAQTPSWTQLFSTNSIPTARDTHTAVYDTTNNRMIVFGGFNINGPLNDVWVLGNANGLGGTCTWVQLSPTPDPTQTTNGYGGLPTPRGGHTAVYDNTNNRMIIFGGVEVIAEWGIFNDTWILSHANGLGGTPSWTKITTTGNTPVGRFNHTAVYDTNHNLMTIFGGYYNGTTSLNDVWVLSNANGLGGTPIWTQITTTGSVPPARGSHTAVYDTTNNRMTIFGGSPNLSGYNEFNDVWVLSNPNGQGGNSTWAQLFPTGSIPTTRDGHSAVYNAVNNRMTIFGGSSGEGNSYLNDVWTLSNANGLGGNPAWTQLFPTGSAPTTRGWHTAIYDAVNNRMTLFGGISFSEIYQNDLWVLSDANGNGIVPNPTAVPKGIWELLDK